MRRVRLLAIAALCASSTLDAQTPARDSVRFAGRLVGVYDEMTGKPIDSVEVRNMTTNAFALTTSTGTLSLFFVDSAGGLLRFRKVGYTPQTIFVDNARGDAPLTVTLDPIATSLPKVVTTDSAPRYLSPALRGFEERRKSGMGGRFVSEATIRKEENRTLGNILQAHVTGLRVLENVKSGGRYMDVALSGRNGKPCPVDIYLDGIPVSHRSTSIGTPAIPQAWKPGQPKMTDDPPLVPTNDLRDFLPKDLAGIEYYSAATVPVDFNRTASGCGVLLLWTRER